MLSSWSSGAVSWLKRANWTPSKRTSPPYVPEPNVTVAGLANRADGAFGQAVLSLPTAHDKAPRSRSRRREGSEDLAESSGQNQHNSARRNRGATRHTSTLPVGPARWQGRSGRNRPNSATIRNRPAYWSMSSMAWAASVAKSNRAPSGECMLCLTNPVSGSQLQLPCVLSGFHQRKVLPPGPGPEPTLEY